MRLIPLTEKSNPELIKAAEASGVKVGEYYLKDDAGIIAIGPTVPFMYAGRPNVSLARFDDNGQVIESLDYVEDYRERPVPFKEYIEGDVYVRLKGTLIRAKLQQNGPSAVGFIAAVKAVEAAENDVAWAARSPAHAESVENSEYAGGRVILEVSFSSAKSAAGRTFFKSKHHVPLPATKDDSEAYNKLMAEDLVNA